MWLCRCVWVYVGGLSWVWAYGHDGWIVRIPLGLATLASGPWVWIVQVGSETSVLGGNGVRGRFPGRWDVRGGFPGKGKISGS